MDEKEEACAPHDSLYEYLLDEGEQHTILDDCSIASMAIGEYGDAGLDWNRNFQFQLDALKVCSSSSGAPYT